MCGIAGYFFAKRNKDLLLSMISQLEHRGPDGFGYYLDKMTGLAHARLSIIDVEGGAQPMCNEDGTIWTVFNGEIYNYLELRSLLEGRGHIFKTFCDTEIIVHAYEEFGTEMFSIFNGQFAIAVWDSVKGKAILARDRVGIQPLFYTRYENTFYFASEIKAMLVKPELNRGLDTQEIANVFTYWSCKDNSSVFQNIYEVQPGEIIELEEGINSIIKNAYMYWDHEYNRTSRMYNISEYLNNAVELRLRADVPVAAYLSGGLDSSLIVSYAKQHTDNLNTFSIQFGDLQYDESKYQNIIQQKYGIKHHMFTCTQDDIENAFIDTVFHAEKPLFRTAPVPMFLLSKMVKETGFKVVLTGEGADEVFGGYDIFRESMVRQIMLNKDKEPAFINALVQNLYPWMSDKMLTSNVDYLKLFFGKDAAKNSSLFYFSHDPRIRSSSKSHIFFNEDVTPAAPDLFFKQMMKRLPSSPSSLNTAQYIEFKTLFNGYLISSQGDRMLMAHGVEGRFPFLDPNVVDYGNSLEDLKKICIDKKGNITEKVILKELGQNRALPLDIVTRSKQPYMAPDAQSFIKNERWVEYVEYMFSRDYGYFDLNKAARLKNKFLMGKASGFAENMAFMGILSTQLLHNSMVENFVPKPIVNMDRFQVKVEK